jgi:hypothetical protein
MATTDGRLEVWLWVSLCPTRSLVGSIKSLETGIRELIVAQVNV